MRASYFTGIGREPAPNFQCPECGSEELHIFALTALTFETWNTDEGLHIGLIYRDDASQSDYFWQEGGLTVRCPYCDREWIDEELRVHYDIE